MPAHLSPSGTTAAAANKVALASSIAALLMFGALVYNGSPRHAAVAEMPPPPLEATTISVQESPATESSAADVEADAADENETKVRRAATDFLREKFPNAKAEGVFLLSFGRDSNLYFARIDATLPEGRRPVSCLIFQYVRKNGSPYWRAEGLSHEEEAAYLKKAEQSPEFGEPAG